MATCAALTTGHAAPPQLPRCAGTMRGAAGDPGTWAGCRPRRRSPPTWGSGRGSAGFTTDELSALLSERTVVRAPIMRATVHLADTADFVAFRPLFGSLMAAGLRANYARTLTGVDPDALAAQAAGPTREVPADPRSASQGPRGGLAAAEPMSLAYAVTYLVPVVQVPPRGIWGKNARPPGPPPNPGWPSPSARPNLRRSTPWSCATWPRSARRPWRTSRPGPA